MEANHIPKNAFSSDLDLPKSKFFPSVLTMKFLFSRAITLIAIALAKFRNPVLHVLTSYLIGEKVSNYQKITCPSSIGNNVVGKYSAMSLMLGGNGNLISKATEVNILLHNVCN